MVVNGNAIITSAAAHSSRESRLDRKLWSTNASICFNRSSIRGP